MDPSLRNDLVYRKENIYFALVIVVSILTYLFLAISIFGIFIIIALILLSLLFHGIMMGGIRRNGVKISEHQFPDLYEKAAATAKEMGLEKVPDIYVIESEGMLNAFATRFFRKNMVVLYSEIFEMMERGAEKEVLFVLAHEFAHLKRKHVLIGTFILPAMWIPFLGTAYLRACEYTCDRYAAYYVGSYEAAKNALTMLAIGKELYPKVNQENYMKQLEEEHGFFVWLNEKLSTHPHLPKRLYELSKFFEREATLELKEPKGKVIIGILVAFVSVIVLTVGLTTAFAALGNSGFLDELTADLDYEDYEIEGITPLMEAAGENDAETVMALLDEGTEIDAVDEEDTTALHWAAYNGSVEAAQVLIEAGANLDTVDFYDQTPLISAIYNGDIDMVALLLENGADTTYEDPYGYTAYDYAVENGEDNIAALLENE